jgi:hypothetical protein
MARISGGKLLPAHVLWILVIPQPDKTRMPKMILWRPFREFELARESFKRPAIRHFGGR